MWLQKINKNGRINGTNDDDSDSDGVDGHDNIYTSFCIH